MFSSQASRAVNEILEALWSVPAHDFSALEVCTLTRLMELVHASDAAVIISTRDPTRTDRLGGARPARTISPWSGPERERITKDWLRNEDWMNDPVLVQVTGGHGSVRLIPQCDATPIPGWDSSAARRLNQQLGVGSRLIGIRPIAEDTEVHFIVDRPPGERPFSTLERETLASVVPALLVPACRIALSYGLASGAQALTPREREVLRWLLTAMSEKEIAAELGLGRRAAHHHVTSIFRKFGVTSRAGLMSQWLSAPPRLFGRVGRSESPGDAQRQA